LVFGCLRPWCISFSSFSLLLIFLPKQWYHISHAPPAHCTSPPYFPLLWTPIFSWLLCEPLLLIGGHPKATVYFIYIFFHCLNSHPKRWDGVPPHTLPPTSLHPNISPTTSTDYWLIVGYQYRSAATSKANALPISLFFDLSLFGTPNKGTNGGESKPNATCLPLTDRNRRHLKLGPWQVLPWR